MAPTGTLTSRIVLLEDSNPARLLHDRSRYGTKGADKSIELSLVEAYHLLGIDKLTVLDRRGTVLDRAEFSKRAHRIDPRFGIKAAVYTAARKNGYILKTALKYGADFRVYERGISPGDEHSTWLCYACAEHERMSMTEYVARNRVAHSTRKKLLLGIVDTEGSVTFYENGWVKL
jgi:tRNA-intron endonuclease, archaea type